MNILIITAMFPPIRTGTSFYSKNLANALSKLGHKVVVATVKNAESHLCTYGFPVYRLPALHFKYTNSFKHLRFSSVYLSNYRQLTAIAREHKTEVVLLVNHYLDIAFPAIYCTRRLKLPLYISVGTQMQSLNPFRNRILRMLDRVICGRLIFPFSRNIISWDSEIERYIKEVQRKKISEKSVIIPFGANIDYKQVKSYQHDYSKTEQIIGVGAIISQRDYLFNLKVFKELLRDFPHLRLKIVGHIYEQSPIKLARELGISDKVDFVGEAPHETVIKEMKKSVLHWMMLSGEYVGLGTATLEAMTLGIPCVSNIPENLFGSNRLIDMETYIYAGSNLQEVKEKLVKVLSNEELRRNIGENGRSFVTRYLNWEIVAHEMTQLFKSSKSTEKPITQL